MSSTIKMYPGKHTDVFDKIIESHSSLLDLLLTHKADYYNAKKMIDKGCIEPTSCDVFEGEKLVYLFYGRPSYVVAQGKAPRKDHSYFPVCFLLKPSLIKISNIFPFDSGAFNSNIYEGFLHEDMNIYDFALPPSIDYVKRFISTFYQSNKNYYMDACVENFENLNYNPCDDLELEAYINIITNKGSVQFDSRGTTIEIISHHSIDLTENLQAVFLPLDLYRSNNKIKEYEKNGIDVITYLTFGDEPASYNGIIKEKVYNYLKQNGLL